MSFVDRSGTNWLPWKSLSGASPRLVVIGGIATILGTAGILFKTRQNYTTSSRPKTLSPEWKEATAERIRTGVEREAADPIPLNPILHHKSK